MYVVLVPFHDLQDDNHIYMPEDIYPRKGYKPEKARIQELSSSENLIGVPLIIEKQDEESTKKTSGRKREQ